MVVAATLSTSATAEQISASDAIEKIESRDEATVSFVFGIYTGIYRANESLIASHKPSIYCPPTIFVADGEAYPAVPGRSRYGMSSSVSRRPRRPMRDEPWPGVERFRSFKRSSPTRQAARPFCRSVVGPAALFAPVVARNGRRRSRVVLTPTSASIVVGKRQSFRER